MKTKASASSGSEHKARRPSASRFLSLTDLLRCVLRFSTRWEYVHEHEHETQSSAGQSSEARDRELSAGDRSYGSSYASDVVVEVNEEENGLWLAPRLHEKADADVATPADETVTYHKVEHVNLAAFGKRDENDNRSTVLAA